MIVVVLVAVALLVWALQRAGSHPLAGSSDVVDRDVQRLHADLAVLEAHSARTPKPSRRLRIHVTSGTRSPA